jgi:hypothetical protein
MATAQRDDGLDKLEAFIALLDATHDRLQEGAERLEAAAEQLEEHEDDLDDLAGAITRGGEGAIAMAMTATTALAGVTSDSESEEDPIVARLTALAELATALQVYVKDIVTGDVAEDLQAQEKEELDRLAATLVRLQAMASQLREHLLVLQERELETTRQKEKELQAAACVKVWAIALAVAVTIVAVVVAVFTLGSTLLLFAAVALAVVACVGALVQAVLIVIENLPALLRAMGFDEHADAMAEWMDEDWFKWACTAVMVATVIAALIGSLGAALSVATVVLALSVPLTIATCVVANVARLLSALNPFD